jgi:hypothetical protein
MDHQEKIAKFFLRRNGFGAAESCCAADMIMASSMF